MVSRCNIFILYSCIIYSIYNIYAGGGDRRLGAGVRGAQLAPRVSVTRQQASPSSAAAVDVDTPDLFPDECLIHEDCDQDKYCSPAPALKCVNACTLPGNIRII